MSRPSSFGFNYLQNIKNSIREKRASKQRDRRRFFQEFNGNPLEKRQLLATYVVDDFSDALAGSGSNGTLRWAIQQANTNAGDDIINFSGTWPETITLTAANGPISSNDTSGGNLTINGPGQANLTISGGNVTGIFNIESNTTIENLSIKYGIRTGITDIGGAIFSKNTNLTINNSTLADNNSNDFGAAVFNCATGSNNTYLAINNSTLANNTVPKDGGAVFIQASTYGTAILLISNSTLANNTASWSGGAVYSQSGGGASSNA
ncbi:MAG: hypothetical protein RJA81_687, partial [Planctomycetota bacterium]